MPEHTGTGHPPDKGEVSGPKKGRFLFWGTDDGAHTSPPWNGEAVLLRTNGQRL